MSRRRKSDRCSSCGSAETVEAIDNHGQPYVGCAHCRIAAGDTKPVGTYAAELDALRAQLAQVTAELAQQRLLTKLEDERADDARAKLSEARGTVQDIATELQRAERERDEARHAHACAEEIGDVVKRALVRTRRNARVWKAAATMKRSALIREGFVYDRHSHMRCRWDYTPSEQKTKGGG